MKSSLLQFFFYGTRVARLNQTIIFAALPQKTFGDPPFTLVATASSGLLVTFTIVSGPATLLGDVLTLTGPGTVVVRASQAGDATYNAAPNVDQSFAVIAEEDLARRFWRNGYAYPKRIKPWSTGFKIKLPLVAAASAAARALGNRRYAQAGVVLASATAQSTTTQRQRLRAVSGRATSRADARTTVTTARVFSSAGRPSVSASASVSAQSARRTLQLGCVTTAIGPDEVAAEFEEILFLLEVA